jgi:caffeoyl-CoA O-methyltransferase
VILDDAVSDYLTDLAVAGHHDQVLVEMESRAAEHGFPIVGRAVGRFLETAARMVGARRVCELGSGYGYSAYWFARVVGPDGEVVCTDGSADNATLAENYLRRADLWAPITWHTGDALEGLAATEGEFDVIYCDVDKGGYPDCWEAARQRIRVGGIWLCDNVLWGGRVVTGEDREGLPAGWTAAIQQMNRAVADDPDWISTLAPIRDGVLLAVRIR